MQPAIEEIVYVQKSDCCDPNMSPQKLTVRIENGGGGGFVVLETNRWSLHKDEFLEFFEKIDVDNLVNKHNKFMDDYCD